MYKYARDTAYSANAYMDGSCRLAAPVVPVTPRPDSFGLGDDPAGLGDAGVAWPNPSGSVYELLSRLNCSDDVRNGLLLV